MARNVGHLLTGWKWVTMVTLDLNLSKKQENKSVLFSHLKVAQNCQKAYADKRIPLQFEVGDHVYLKVSPMRGVHRFGVHGKLAPHYVGPYKILEQCGFVAYRLQLLDILSVVHNVFHVSQLKKCLRVPNEVVEIEGLPLQPDLLILSIPSKSWMKKRELLETKW